MDKGIQTHIREPVGRCKRKSQTCTSLFFSIFESKLNFVNYFYNFRQPRMQLMNSANCPSTISNVIDKKRNIHASSWNEMNHFHLANRTNVFLISIINIVLSTKKESILFLP